MADSLAGGHFPIMFVVQRSSCIVYYR